MYLWVLQKEFERPKSHARGNTYCSRECRSKAKTAIIKCAYCGTEQRRPKCEIKSENHFCSRRCANLFMRKGGEQNQGRRSPEDREWKQKVLKKDGYKCGMCGTDRKLEAHHIKPIKDFPGLRHEISNGDTYCHNCHYYKVHNGMPNFKHGKYIGQRKRKMDRLGDSVEAIN